MKQHDLSRGAMLLFVFGFLFGISAIAFAGGSAPVIIISTGDRMSPAVSAEPSARYAFHQTYGNPSSDPSMPSVWIYIAAQKKPGHAPGSFYGEISYDSNELIIPAAPGQEIPAHIASLPARSNPAPTVLMVVLPNGMSQRQGSAASVGVVLVEEPGGAWVKPLGPADGQLQVVHRGPRRGPVR